MRLEPFLLSARSRGASDIHLVAGLPPAYRVDGEILVGPGDALSRESLQTLVEGMLDPIRRERFERERELCFSTEHALAGRFRVAAYFRAGSPELAIRMCAKAIPSARELGLPAVVDTFARRKAGLVLITGPAGAGKSTTMASMIDLINRERRCKIVTIEDPVEYVHAPQKAIIVQQEVYSDTLSFSRALVHVLRQDPDVIGIGEMRDLETIETALTASETGHLVLATLHTPSAPDAVDRIMGTFPPAQQDRVALQFASTLEGVVAQELLPRADRKGRVLACEVLVANSAVRNMIRERHAHMLGTAMETGGREGMQTMDRVLLKLYQEGTITYDAMMAKVRNPEMVSRERARGAGNGRS